MAVCGFFELRFIDSRQFGELCQTLNDDYVMGDQDEEGEEEDYFQEHGFIGEMFFSKFFLQKNCYFFNFIQRNCDFLNFFLHVFDSFPGVVKFRHSNAPPRSPAKFFELFAYISVFNFKNTWIEFLFS